ncbi:MAG: hypothetical protein QOI63_1270 [Thermoplasmata archaeon]|nr:hypothetical protein [Thermoplasmata archaeon]
MAVGGGFTCVLKASGNADCYGSNDGGQAADYNGGDATAVSAGYHQACFLKANRNVHCQGSGAIDYLNGDATAVSAGPSHACVLKASGGVHCFGDNQYGKADDYTGTNAIAVSAGGSHTCLVLVGGFLSCHGNNFYGAAPSSYPGNVVAVSAGLSHTCVLTAEHNVDCFGSNSDGQVVDDWNGDALAVSAGGWTTCILKVTGNVDCSGLNPDGRADDYTGGDAVAVSAGPWHTCELKASGDVHCHGENFDGGANPYDGRAWPPGGLTATAGPGAGEIQLAWQAPTETGGSPVASYRVYRGTASGGSGTPVTTGGCANLGTPTGCTDTGLANDVHYYYRVTSVNAMGESFASDQAGDWTFAGPTAPRSLQATPGGTSVSLAWLPPYDDGGMALTYQVYRAANKGPAALLASTAATSYVDGTCLGLCDYTVRAVNGAGPGPFSNQATSVAV